MSRRERLALAIVLGLGVVGSATVGTAAYLWHRAGTIRIDVHETGTAGSDVSVRIPGALVNAAIALLPVSPDLALDTEVAELGPLLLAVAEQLDTMPDAVLVDVREKDSSVRVAKSGGEIIVQVLSEADRVEVAVPIRSARRALAKIGRIATARRASGRERSAARG